MALSEEAKQKWLSEDNHRVVLVELEYHDSTSMQTLRIASHPYIMPIGDSTVDQLDGSTVLTNLSYDDVVSKVPNIITRIDSSTTTGSIEVTNVNGEYDYMLTDVSAVGHSVRLYIGDVTWSKDNFLPILSGTIRGISSSTNTKITINIRDKKEVLSVPVQTQLISTPTLTNAAWALLSPTEKAYTDEYWHKLMDEISALAPSGVIPDGGPGIGYSRAQAVLPEATENTHVPICLGKCFNIEPVLIDSWNHIYLIHDSVAGIVSIDEIRSNGIVLAGSQYETDIGIGIIRLLDHDQGTQITCDVVGQAGRASGIPAGSEALTLHSAAHLIEWILLEKTTLTFPTISQDTFPPTGTNGFDTTSALGLFIKGDSTVIDTCTKLINSVGGFLRFRADTGNVELYKFEDPTNKSVNLYMVADDILQREFNISSISDPKKSITLGYMKNWSMQDDGVLAGSITDASSTDYDINRLNAFKNEYSTAYATTGVSLIEYPLAEDVPMIESLIYEKAGADIELLRRISLRSTRRITYKIKSVATSFTYIIGDIINITHPKYGFEDGKNVMIIGIEESPTSKRVTIEVWA